MFATSSSPATVRAPNVRMKTTALDMTFLLTGLPESYWIPAVADATTTSATPDTMA